MLYCCCWCATTVVLVPTDAGISSVVGVPTDAGISPVVGVPTDAGISPVVGVPTDAGIPAIAGLLSAVYVCDIPTVIARGCVPAVERLLL